MFTIHGNCFLEVTTVYLKSFIILKINHVADKRVSQFFKRKETAKLKRKQTSTDTFCVKTYRHMFNDEVICWNTRKKEETARPVGRPRKYDNSISVNELHDFNDLLEFDKWYNEKYSKRGVARVPQV